MTCNSCEKIIEKTISRNGGTSGIIDANRGLIEFDAEENKFSDIKKALSEKGYRESGPETVRGGISNFVNYLKSIALVKKGLEIEAKTMNYAFASLLVIAAIAFSANYFLFSGSTQGVFFQLIILSTLSSVLFGYSYNSIMAYKGAMPCSLGMMAGMTIGMVSGFMSGAIIAGTNGMFFGSFSGIIVGSFLGVKTGKCCGIMGAMEGIMAGFMGGLMGAMTTIMMLNDNAVIFMYLALVICSVIVLGMNYMMYRENGPMPKMHKNSFPAYMAMPLAIALLMFLFFTLAPKGILTLVG